MLQYTEMNSENAPDVYWYLSLYFEKKILGW